MKFARKVPDSVVNRYKDATPPFGPVGYVTYKRTYARRLDEHRTEEWLDTTRRCVQGLIDIGGAFTSSELESLFDHWFNLRVTTGGRGLWQLGTQTVQKLGADSLQNCWHLPVGNAHGPTKAFTFTFNQLMLGGGVGFNILPEHVYELPTIVGGTVIRSESWDCGFIVPDNREGWVTLLELAMTAHFTGGTLIYNTDAIRSRGKEISGFGGTASGSEILVHGIGQISKIMKSRIGRKLRPIDCLDIMNIIGSIVVAGNVRRSAQIAIGSPFDEQFLNAKNWGRHQIPDWRTMSNNTVQTATIEQLAPPFWEGYSGEAEPYGLFNANLARTHGRLVDGPDYRPDPNVCGLNPCGEITLEPYEACNLVEIFLPNLESPEQFNEVAQFGVKIAKTISAFPFGDPVAQATKERNHRIGIGVTGVLQHCPGIGRSFNTDEYDAAYRAAEDADRSYSARLGINESIKLTTVKPSGTLSLLAGCTSGAHPAISPWYLRRIRFAADDPLVTRCRDHGYHVEPRKNLDGGNDMGTMVVSFPVAAPRGARYAHEMNVFDQLNVQRLLQNYWADNSVSVTCYYQPEELEALKEHLASHYETGIKACSFLLYQGHGFVQAPLEPISKDQYLALSETTTPISEFKDEGDEDRTIGSVECASGHCPVR